MTRPSWYLTDTLTFTGRRQQFNEDGTPATDRYGNDVYADVPFTVTDCTWEPRTSISDESNDAAQQVVTGINVFCANPDVDIRETDKATIDGLSYEVHGPVARYRGARMAGNNHAFIVLRRVSG